MMSQHVSDIPKEVVEKERQERRLRQSEVACSDKPIWRTESTEILPGLELCRQVIESNVRGASNVEMPHSLQRKVHLNEQQKQVAIQEIGAGSALTEQSHGQAAKSSKIASEKLPNLLAACEGTRTEQCWKSVPSPSDKRLAVVPVDEGLQKSSHLSCNSELLSGIRKVKDIWVTCLK